MASSSIHLRFGNGFYGTNFMPEFSVQRTLPYTADEMFALVADIDRYPEFLPLCENMVTRERTRENDLPVVYAEMHVGYKSFNESFTSRVELNEPEKTIAVTYVDGPFKYLENVWQFHPVRGGGSQVDFHIRYAFNSALLSIVMGGFFDKAFRRFSFAFESRARHIYGDRTAVDPSAGDQHEWLNSTLRS